MRMFSENWAVASRVLPSAALVAACSCCVLVMTSCGPASTANAVVTKALSPDGEYVALLIDRYYHAARVADEFFLVIVPNTRNIDGAITARNLGKSAALVATRAGSVELRWQDNRTLLVVCNSCGLEAIDISKKLDHIGRVKIIYQGFPEHTAYD
jgi:hypothetical protein